MNMRWMITIVSAATLMSCAGSREEQKTPPESGFEKELATYEASFHPSEYDPDTAHQRNDSPALNPGNPGTPAIDTSAQGGAQVVSGFRVQVFSSMRIDEAKNSKAQVEALFPSEWFYLEYDSPAYKVRAGNFLTRFDAERFVKQLGEKGYTDAWTVPARVFRNPPPPPPPATPPDQTKQRDQ